MQTWKNILLVTLVILSVIITSIFVYFWSKDSCPVGTFACSLQGKCIPNKFVCNDHNDCENNDDEDTALCTDSAGSVAMIDKYLDRNTTIFDIQYNCDLRKYPSNCICKYSTALLCQDNALIDIPQNISPNVTHLLLLNNEIQYLEGDDFNRYVNLKVLYSRKNPIKEISPATFMALHYLNKLVIIHSSLTLIQDGILSGLSSLQWLILDSNNLSYIYIRDLEDLVWLEWLSLSNNSLTLRDESFPSMPCLIELCLDFNKIEVVTNYTFRRLENLHLLSLRSNQIIAVHDDALNLYGNRITKLSSNVFRSLKSLTKLYLGNNPFHYMSNNMLLPLVSLESLNMEDIEITSIDVKMFSNLKNLKSVYFKKYRYCVFAATVPRCRPLSDGVSSFSQLIVKPVLRYSLWIIAMMTCVGNMLVIWGRFVFRDENKVLSVIIRNLAASDLLMGLYLSIIAFHDLKFRDIYHEEAHLWMSSWTCTTAGILAMISSEVSVLVLVFMSIDRFLLIASPFGRYSSLTVKETHVILTCIWFIGGGLAVIPALWLATSTWFYGINGLCLPLYIDDPFMVGWKVSAIIFFGINAIGLLIVIVVYIGMFLSIWKTRKASALPIREFEFALRFLFIVLTDASCRLPIIVAKAIAFLEIEISSDIYSWLVVFVLPINSALNPFLYTFTTPKYRSHVRKAGLQVCLQEVKKNLSQHPLPESYGDTGSLPVSNKSGQSISLKCISVKQ